MPRIKASSISRTATMERKGSRIDPELGKGMGTGAKKEQ
jgi:hypothetical protein